MSWFSPRRRPVRRENDLDRGNTCICYNRSRNDVRITPTSRPNLAQAAASDSMNLWAMGAGPRSSESQGRPLTGQRKEARRLFSLVLVISASEGVNE